MIVHRDPELEYRRTLMKAAAMGDAIAQRQLWTEYRIRIWTSREMENQQGEEEEDAA